MAHMFAPGDIESAYEDKRRPGPGRPKRKIVPDQPAKQRRPHQAAIVHWQDDRDGRPFKRAGKAQLPDAAEQADDRNQSPGKGVMAPPKEQHRQAKRRQREKREPEHDSPRAFRPGKLTQKNADDADHDRSSQRHCGPDKRKMRAIGLDHDENAAKPDQHRAPPMNAGFFLQNEGGKDRCEDRNRKAYRGGFGERQQNDGTEIEDHAGQASDGAPDMAAQTFRSDRLETLRPRHPGDDERHCKRLAIK